MGHLELIENLIDLNFKYKFCTFFLILLLASISLIVWCLTLKSCIMVNCDNRQSKYIYSYSLVIGHYQPHTLCTTFGQLKHPFCSITFLCFLSNRFGWYQHMFADTAVCGLKIRLQLISFLEATHANTKHICTEWSLWNSLDMITYHYVQKKRLNSHL